MSKDELLHRLDVLEDMLIKAMSELANARNYLTSLRFLVEKKDD